MRLDENALVQVREVVATLSNLEEAGATVEEGLLAARVRFGPQGGERGKDLAEWVHSLREVASARVAFQADGLSFELVSTPEQPLGFSELPSGDPASVFTAVALAEARRAWAGDTKAALGLAGTWSATIDIDLARPVSVAHPELDCRVVRGLQVVVESFRRYPWWRIAELVRPPSSTRPVLILVVREDQILFQTRSLVVSSLDSISNAEVPAGISARRETVAAASGLRYEQPLPLPEELLAVGQASGAPALEALLVPMAEACAWAWMADRVDIADDASVAWIEYFGYRRRRFRVPPEGYTGAGGQRAFSLYLWAVGETSPDRVLAVRQVASLHDAGTLPARPDDIKLAAEPIYRALRASEVGAVLETQRQARSIAIEAARESAAATQAAAKAAAERTIASLAAVGGIALAHATDVLDKSDARGIALGIAALFGFLLAWALLLEGPTLAAPLRSFEKDLSVIGRLLSPSERGEILGLDVVKHASRRAAIVRVTSLVVYALGALVTLGVAVARFELRF